MKFLLSVFICLISMSALSQKKDSIVLNSLQISRFNNLEKEKEKIIKEFDQERIKILWTILESHNINPSHIDTDSLIVEFIPGKILILRKNKKK